MEFTMPAVYILKKGVHEDIVGVFSTLAGAKRSAERDMERDEEIDWRDMGHGEWMNRSMICAFDYVITFYPVEPSL
jgi:hypothetical protein